MIDKSSLLSFIEIESKFLDEEMLAKFDAKKEATIETFFVKKDKFISTANPC